MEGQKTSPRVDGLFEYGYLLLVGLAALTAFRYTTTLPEDSAVAAALHLALQIARAALWVLTGLKTLWQLRRWSWKELVPAAILCAALLASWLTVRRTYVIELAVLIVGARGVDFRKIAKVWFGVCAAALLVTCTLALTGVIENLVYESKRGLRISFGCIYPTDFACHVFFLAAGWAWIRERRITLWELAAIAALGVFCLRFCSARNSAGCLFLLAAGLLYLRLRRRGSRRRGRSYRPVKPVRGVLPFAAPILAAVMILLSAVYTKKIGWMARLNTLLSRRLIKGRTAFMDFPVTLFGQDVPMSGRGRSTANTEGFFLDSSYLNVLFCFGLVTLLCILGIMVLCALREKRLGAWERLGILTVVAVQCLMEHHMIEMVYNLFLLLPLAVSVSPPPDIGSIPDQTE